MARLRGPVRTCVGCRVKAARSTLLRVVAVGGVLVPDPAGRLPGRGASVHLDPACVALADKRRAFPRALRLTGTPDVSPVLEHVAAALRRTGPAQQGSPGSPTGTTSTTPSTTTSTTTGTTTGSTRPGPGNADESRQTREQHPMSTRT